MIVFLSLVYNNRIIGLAIRRFSEYLRKHFDSDSG